VAGRIAFWVLRDGTDRHQEAVAELQSWLQLLGLYPAEAPPEAPGEEPLPEPVPGPEPGGRIFTEFGAPPEDLDRAIRQYWPESQWQNAARMAYVESNGWKRDAERNTLGRAGGRCNIPIGTLPDGTPILSEQSVGYFQINVCAHGHDRAYWIDTDHNVSYAAQLYREKGWGPWQVSARLLGLR
jgi:hypothetical protein